MALNELFNNENFVTDSLIGIVRDEGHRILANKLASREQLNSLVDSVVSAVFEKKYTSSNFATYLSSLHKTLASVKLPGDFEKIGLDPLAINLNKLTEQEYEQQFDKLDEIKEKLDADVCEKVVEKTPPSTTVENESIAFVGEQLEKISYDLGSRGHHGAAYLVERTIQKIKQ